jgi:hypothetical protein
MIMNKIGSLYFSSADGEGAVIFKEEFENLDPLLKADILKDWIADLDAHYNQAVKQVFPDIGNDQ